MNFPKSPAFRPADKAKETEAQKITRLRALRLERDALTPPPKPPSRATLRKRAQTSPSARVWSLTDELTFGKYVGKTIAQVLEENRGWLTWALECIPFFELDEGAQAEYDAADDPRAPPRAWASPRY